MGYLIQIEKGGVVQQRALDGSPATIGRTADNEVVVSNSHVSRHHARIESRGGATFLTDLESTHGTFLNSKKVSGTEGGVALSHGDRISLGKKFDFLYLDHEDPATTDQAILDLKIRDGEVPSNPTSKAYGDKLQQILHSAAAAGNNPAILQGIQEEVQRSVFELKCLYEIGFAINSELDLDKVLELILKNVLKATQGDRGYILLKDPANPEALTPVIAMGPEGVFEGDEWDKYSRSLAAEALQRRECVVSRDADLDPEKARHSVIAMGIRWSICSPLISRGNVLGVLYVDALEKRRKFSDEDVTFFTALCTQSAIAIENARLYRDLRATHGELERKVRELSALYDVSKSLQGSSDLQGVLTAVLDRSIETVGCERGSVMLRADDEDAIEVRVCRGPGLDPAHHERVRLRPGEGIAGGVMSTGQGIIDNEGARSASFVMRSERDRDVRQILCAPLVSSKDTLGVINLVNKTGAPGFTRNDLELMRTIASQTAVTIENTRLYDLAVYDGLTRVHIRRFFDAWITKELERSRRYGSALSIILLDIDHFKHINDTYGHPTGDAVLVEVAKLFRDSIRSTDVVARYGGEEFIIGLPDTTLEGAIQFAERVRQKIEAHTIHHMDHTLQITISLGVAQIEGGQPLTAKQLIRMADIVLYEAKQSGRNRVGAYRRELRLDPGAAET